MDNFSKIQDYLFNRMSEDDRLNFEQELSHNQELASALEFQRFENQIIDDIEEDALRAKANAIKERGFDENTEQKPPIIKQLDTAKKTFPIRRVLSLAAGILLLIGFFYFSNTTDSNNGLVAYGYEKANTSYTLSTRSGTDSEVLSTKYIQVLKSRDQSQAQEAINYFSTFENPEDPNYVQAKINLAHAHILADRYQKSLDIFLQLEKSTQVKTREKEDIVFYKALVLLALDRTQEGKILMNKIVSSNGRYKPIAQSVLHKFY